MIKHIKNIDINYEEYGNNKGDAIVLLHGWGQNIQMMKPIGDELQKNNHIIIIDLPGHGFSDEPDDAWTIYDFADMIYDFLKELKVKKPILIGHSFGGQIAIAYASIYETKKLVLLASPFHPQKTKPSLKIKIIKKIGKIPFLKKYMDKIKSHMGSTDYRNAHGVMRDILVKKVNLDMTNDAKKIKCPTLIVWGTKDSAVPVEDAYMLEELIPDSGKIIYPECTHYAYLEVLPDLIKALRVFIES